ncbi:MAG: hypothetical protein DMF61_23900 [Blastocatellia bacterium AA13]|nr:MAG: hypothetical protein DMF61_23900 [Blastocatellia bacterium AA13]
MRRNGGTMKRIREGLLKGIGLLIFCLAMAEAPAMAQAAKLQLPNLDHLRDKATEVVDVSLDGALLRLASKALSSDTSGNGAKIQEMIQGLQGVYVKSYEFDKEGQYSKEDVEAIRAQVMGGGWQRVVGVLSKHDGDNVEVYAMNEGNQVTGLAIIAADPKELTIVNIVGPVDLEKLVELGGKLGIPRLEKGKEKKSKKE